MLEDQLETSRKRVEQVLELENDILKYKAGMNELILVLYLFFSSQFLFSNYHHIREILDFDLDHQCSWSLAYLMGWGGWHGAMPPPIDAMSI